MPHIGWPVGRRTERYKLTGELVVDTRAVLEPLEAATCKEARIHVAGVANYIRL